MLQLIWDIVIHWYMEFHPLLVAFIDTMQRLRYVKQLRQYCIISFVCTVHVHVGVMNVFIVRWCKFCVSKCYTH